MDICQVAYFVQDASVAAKKMRGQFACGPFFLAEKIPLAWAQYQDKPIEFVHTSAYGQWGDIMLELVQLDSEPFPLFERTGIHHVATMVDSLETAYEQYSQQGYDVALKAMTETGTEFAFIDARAEFGHLIEIYEHSEALTGFYQYIKDAAASSDPEQVFIR